MNKLVQLISQQAAKYGTREVIRHKSGSGNDWVSISWIEFSHRVELTALAMKKIGIKQGDNVAVFSHNRADMFATDFGLFYNQAVPVPLYATSGHDQVKYIIEDASIEYIFVGNDEQYKIARIVQKQIPYLKQIICYQDDVVIDDNDSSTITFERLLQLAADATADDNNELQRRMKEGSSEQMACLIYTSGTTGEPKGVVLTHSNFDEQLQEHIRRIPEMSDSDISMNFLPLTHIFERAWCYLCLMVGMRIVINTNPHDIQQAIFEIQPTCMCCVPRFWEKVYTVLCDKISKMRFFNRLMIKAALNVGRRRNLVYLRAGEKVPWLLEQQYQFFERSIFGRVRRLIGVKRGKMFPTAGAPISPEIVEFMHAIGVNVMVGYGLSETTATVSCFPATNYVIGSIGTPLESLSVKIGDDNEILVKGPSVMKEYYKKPEINATAFTADGYFRTGDAGYIDKKGNLFITERIKDLFKTSNGKYIAPQILESRLSADNLISQVAIIGDQRKFVSALIVPNFDALREYADANGISYSDNKSLAENDVINQYVANSIEKYQVGMAAYEQIKRFTLLSSPFTMENGELTNTLKIKRNVVCKNYANVINKMYK
ncbi:MAG: long-chain fatty acid--CoA ligase [Muribaculaceae bacterium]|nr:long-chain fatty acid--CoA ligase [Muribaculaceae bacterium]